jgi:ubiquinone biosynthesis protein
MQNRNATLGDVMRTIFRALAFWGALGVAAARFAGRLAWSWAMRSPRPPQELLGLSLVELCESLGATYIKIGQLLSTRSDIIPPTVLAQLERLQDRVAPFDSRRVPGILAAQLGHPPAQVFASIEPQPISSASVASVYRATLHSDQTVAVKIRRPEIVGMVHSDLRLMRWGARLLVRLPPLRAVPMVEVIEELGQSIEQQLDFRREAENNRRFRAYFAHDPHIRIPALVEEYCTDAILVMEYMPNLLRINQLHQQGIDYHTSVVTGLKALYQMIFLDGFIHCDLHPGNMYFQAGGDVTLLDMGFVKEFSAKERLLFAKFFFGIVLNKGKECAQIIHETALSVSAAFDYQVFERAVGALIARSTGARAAEFQVASFAMQLFDIQRRCGLRASPNFVMAILALLVFEGIVKSYDADLDFQGEALPFLLRVR